MEIRFIKLGTKGCWEDDCINKFNTIRLGFQSPYHNDCLKGNWAAVEQHWLKARNGNKSTATTTVNQIKAFYELTENDIWITFYKRKMYWCHANKTITELPHDQSRIRKVIDSWKSTDKNGKQLLIENIDGRITKVQGFRGTICKVTLPAYLLNKINGTPLKEALATETTLNTLKGNIETLIKGLWWKDFELLVDLIFSKSGWQRISVLGATEKEIDLDVFSPVTQKRAFIQVKSSTTAKQIQEYYDSFLQYSQYDEMYFIFHSFQGSLTSPASSLHLINISKLADLVIQTGLIDWLIKKRS